LWRQVLARSGPSVKVKARSVLPEAMVCQTLTSLSLPLPTPELSSEVVSDGTGIPFAQPTPEPSPSPLAEPLVEAQAHEPEAVLKEQEVLKEILDGPDLQLGPEAVDPSKPLYSHGRIPILSADLADSRIGAVKPKGLMPAPRVADKMVSGRIPMDDALRSLANKKMPSGGKGIITGKLTFQGLERPPSLQQRQGVFVGQHTLVPGTLQQSGLPMRQGIVSGRLAGASPPGPRSEQVAADGLFRKGGQCGLLRTSSMPQQRLFSDRIPMDLSSIHSRIPLEPGSRSPPKELATPEKIKISVPKTPVSGGSPPVSPSPLVAAMPELALADFPRADELLARTQLVQPGSAPRQLIHSRIPMDLRPPIRLGRLSGGSLPPSMPGSSPSASASTLRPFRAPGSPSPPTASALVAVPGDSHGGRAAGALLNETVDSLAAGLPTPPPSPPLAGEMPPRQHREKAVDESSAGDILALIEKGNSLRSMLLFFGRTEHSLAGGLCPPERTGVNPPQRVQVMWVVILWELAGVTVLAASHTADNVAVDWATVVLDAFVAAGACAVAGAASKLLFRCAGERKWMLRCVWLMQICASTMSSFVFGWFGEDLHPHKLDRVYVGWVVALTFTWCVIEPVWVLLVVSLVRLIVLPPPEAGLAAVPSKASCRYIAEGPEAGSHAAASDDQDLGCKTQMAECKKMEATSDVNEQRSPQKDSGLARVPSR